MGSPNSILFALIEAQYHSVCIYAVTYVYMYTICVGGQYEGASRCVSGLGALKERGGCVRLGFFCWDMCRDSILTNTQSSYIQGIIYASQILQQPVSADGGNVTVTKKLESVASYPKPHH